MFNVRSTRNTAHIKLVLKFLPNSLRKLLGHAPLLLPLLTDAQSIFDCKCSPCLEIVNTTSELTYRWVRLSQI
jgi:hypothetical protein